MTLIDMADLIGYDNNHCLVFKDRGSYILHSGKTADDFGDSDSDYEEQEILETILILPSLRDIRNHLLKKSDMEPDDQYHNLKGNCYAAACALVELIGDDDARAAYGFFCGGSVERPGTWLQRHGWVVYDEYIIDPTRWVFEGVEPYVFICLAEGHEEYDEGMASFRSNRPPPSRDEVAGHGDQGPYEFKWAVDEKVEMETLFGDERDLQQMTKAELFWLANLSPDTVRPFIATLYQGLRRLGMQSLVPIDFWNIYEHWLKKGEVA